jgi:hypothetical protein
MKPWEWLRQVADELEKLPKTAKFSAEEKVEFLAATRLVVVAGFRVPTTNQYTAYIKSYESNLKEELQLLYVALDEYHRRVDLRGKQ